MNFLPSDYKSPNTSNNYMKLQEGENKLRILSAPVLGWEEWSNKKPIRYRLDRKPAKQLDAENPIRHFWAFIVWNYQEEQIQILQITQATIRSCLESLCKDSDWGEPFHYDIKIMKRGEGTNTEYMINPLPHKPIGNHIIEAFKDKRCNLEALFESADPFAIDGKNYTLGFFEVNNSKYPSDDEVRELNEILKGCSIKYQNTVADFLIRQNLPTLADLPRDSYDKIRTKALEEKELFRAAQNGGL